MVTYVNWKGVRVTPWMAYQLNRLDHDIYNAFGVRIGATSGIRTHQEQINIFLDRYVTAGNINGRRVYDTRWWNGQLWYRISSAGTVAVPGTSNHEIQGSRAAVDIYDTGSDAGITVKNSVRGRWLRAREHLYDMDPEGDGFAEGWHHRISNIFNTPPGTPAGGGSKPVPKPVPTPAEPTLEELMSLKSVVIAAQSKVDPKTKDGTILDFEDGFISDWGQVNDSYNTTMGRIFTTGGAIIVTRGHYDKLIRDFNSHMKAKRDHELAIARAQGSGK